MPKEDPTNLTDCSRRQEATSDGWCWLRWHGYFEEADCKWACGECLCRPEVANMWTWWYADYIFWGMLEISNYAIVFFKNIKTYFWHRLTCLVIRIIFEIFIIYSCLYCRYPWYPNNEALGLWIGHGSDIKATMIVALPSTLLQQKEIKRHPENFWNWYEVQYGAMNFPKKLLWILSKILLVTKARWWFQKFFILAPKIGEDSHFD